MSTVKKKVRPGAIQLSEDGTALEVYYESQDIVVLPSGQERVQASKQGVKSFAIQFSAEGDVAGVAARLAASSKLIHPSKAAEVEALVARSWELRSGRTAASASAASSAGSAGSGGTAGAAGVAPHPPPQHSQHPYDEGDRCMLRQAQQQYLLHPQAAVGAPHAGSSAAAAAAAPPPPVEASMDQLEEYIEALYEEDLGTRVAATAAIAALFEAGHAPALARHPTLLQALARLLREDHKRSGELALNLLVPFLLLSHQPACHPLLVQNQVGSISMDIVDLELRRVEHWQAREGLPAADLAARLRTGHPPCGEREQRLAVALGRQEALLFAALHLLLNMAAEDSGVEAKMVRKGLVAHLAALLEVTPSPDLLVLATTFLRKLSLYAEHQAAMGAAGVVARLAALLPSPSAASEAVQGAPPGGGADGAPATAPDGSSVQVRDGELLRSVLRLLHNLSFEPGLRAQMVSAGLIPKAVALLPRGAEPIRRLALGLLCHLSLEDKHRSMFLYTDALPALHQLIMEAPAASGGLAVAAPELAALAANLAENGRVAEELARSGRLEPLLARALDSRDALLWRVARSLAAHDSEAVRACFAPSMPGLVALLMAPDTPGDLVHELLGCLACLDLRGYDYAALLQSSGLAAWLLARLRASGTREAEALGALGALGTLCTPGTAGLLVEGGLVEALLDLTMRHMDEGAFALQTTQAVHRLLLCAPSRDALLQRPELLVRLAELLEAGSREVVRAADAALDCVAGISPEWATSVRRLRFEAHNRLWIDVVGDRLAVEQQAAGGQLPAGDVLMWAAQPDAVAA